MSFVDIIRLCQKGIFFNDNKNGLHKQLELRQYIYIFSKAEQVNNFYVSTRKRKYQTNTSFIIRLYVTLKIGL